MSELLVDFRMSEGKLTILGETRRKMEVQYSAKIYRLGYVNTHPTAKGSQDTGSRNLVFTI